MQPESKSESRELKLKRDRPASSSTNEGPPKKRKQLKSKSFEPVKKYPLRLSGPVAHFKGETPKMSPHRSDISIRTTSIKSSPLSPKETTTKAGIKSDPEPIRSDILYPDINKRGNHIRISEQADDTSDKSSEDENSVVNLQRQLNESIAERDGYREKLHAAKAKVQELQRDEILRKVAEHDEAEKRQADAAEIERSLQSAKERCDLLAKTKESLNEQLKAKQDCISELREGFDQQVEKYGTENKRLQSSQKQTEERLRVEFAKNQALTATNRGLEEQAEEHKAAMSRLQTEVAEAKEALETQKYAADWYKAKFLKFKAAYCELDEERKEKADILRRIMPALTLNAIMAFNDTKLLEEADAVADRVGANDDVPLGGHLLGEYSANGNETGKESWSEDRPADSVAE